MLKRIRFPVNWKLQFNFVTIIPSVPKNNDTIEIILLL